MTELAKRTWPEARDLFDDRLVAILPIGATEPHGEREHDDREQRELGDVAQVPDEIG